MYGSNNQLYFRYTQPREVYTCILNKIKGDNFKCKLSLSLHYRKSIYKNQGMLKEINIVTNMLYSIRDFKVRFKDFSVI